MQVVEVEAGDFHLSSALPILEFIMTCIFSLAISNQKAIFIPHYSLRISADNMNE
jgi:hypothetical protein